MLHYYFIYRLRDLAELDLRTPVGGVVVFATWNNVPARVEKVWAIATARYQCEPGELLRIMEVKAEEETRQVMMMDRDWERSHSRPRAIGAVS